MQFSIAFGNHERDELIALELATSSIRLLGDASVVQLSDATSAAGEVTALSDSPGVFEAITDGEREVPLGVFVWYIVEREVPQQVVFQATANAVLE